MVRMLIRAGVHLLANAVGLIVAAVILSGMTINGAAFVIAVVIFTVVEVVADPLISKIALTSAPALRGGAALVSTFVGLVITVAVSSGLHISGLSTWVLATMIVWLAALLATLILPLFLVKKAVDRKGA
jgi:putative membrane protein